MNLGELAALVTIITPMIGLMPWYLERRGRRRLEVEMRRRIWSDISKVRGLMADLEKDEEQEHTAGPGALQAAGKLTIMLRDLLREACLAEKRMSVDTVRKWRAVGKIASDWQEQMTLMLLESSEIADSAVPELQSRFGASDELPVGHSMRAPQAVRASITGASVKVAPEPARRD